MHHLSQKITYFFLFILLFVVLFQEHLQVICAGIAIFIIGMFFIEEGFKKLSSGILQRLLHNFTNTTPKAVFTGVITTAIVQSSSLVSVLIISFLGAGLIGLHGAIGVIFGSNIGTTATVWIVSAVGLKINIAYYALPMITLGVALRFVKNFTFTFGLGSVLIGLGFIFLGISYMKDGFDILSQNLDVSSYWINGYRGIVLYILLGFLTTIVIQSSTAAMALVVVALLSGQIVYTAAIAFAIGTNIGTTVTAVIGSIGSSSDGKRLALAHFFFNATTAILATALIYPLMHLVDIFATLFSIEKDSYTLKLAIFHTLFNMMGLVVFVPFIPKLEKFLAQRFLVPKSFKVQPKFLNSSAMLHPASAIIALKQELESLLDISTKAIINRLVYIHATQEQIDKYRDSIGHLRDRNDRDIQTFYMENIKPIYGEIIRFSTSAQLDMSEQDRYDNYKLKVMTRELVSSIKYAALLEQSKEKHITSSSKEIEKHYEYLNDMIVLGITTIEHIKQNALEAKDIFKKVKKELKQLDIECNLHNAKIINDKDITIQIASSLMNDTGFALESTKGLLKVAMYLYVRAESKKEKETELI
ncbi:MAG: Na/Pi cotransporter family protein [Campylobacterales bacterium]|nr:Na/Pi cotransporter family protein [Campylobacterales bacterium]